MKKLSFFIVATSLISTAASADTLRERARLRAQNPALVGAPNVVVVNPPVTTTTTTPTTTTPTTTTPTTTTPTTTTTTPTTTTTTDTTGSAVVTTGTTVVPYNEPNTAGKRAAGATKHKKNPRQTQ